MVSAGSSTSRFRGFSGPGDWRIAMRSKSIRIVASLAMAFLAALVVALCLAAPMSFADEGGGTAADALEGDLDGSGLEGAWHNWRPNPGDTVDVSKAGWNTTVHIDKAGEYRLVGQSTNVRVVISAPEGQTVTVKLADGLRIDPSIKSNIGVRTAAIEIAENKNSTVKLVSESGSSSYFGSYLLCPAIRKDGTQTKLVFETEDPDNPGTITAHASHSSGSAGIGSVYVLMFTFSGTTGNIEFNSGKVVAQGGNGAAGIGGGCRGHAQNITINGGIVEAKGDGGGAGIGGGWGCNGKDITINGGTVTATGEEGGAGIGGGRSYYGPADWIASGENIHINGGNVTAKATVSDGAGIGSGGDGNTRGIYITGGTVYAEGSGDGSGIGSGGSSSGATDINISGGDITAIGGKGNNIVKSSESAGIGGYFYCSYKDGKVEKVWTNIVISGGTVNATGKIGIGTIKSTYVSKYDKHETTITISGGTITAKGIDNHQDIGDYNSSSGCTTIITGGSINASKVRNPVDKWGESVSKTTVAIDGAANGTCVSSIDLYGTAHASAPYGTKDVRTIGDQVYPWIHSGNSVTSAVDEDGGIYTGKVDAGKSGKLSKTPNIVLDANGPDGSTGFADGSAYARSYTTKLHNVTAPTGSDGWTLIGYGNMPDPNAEGAEVVANADGSLVNGVEGYTDGDGRWVRQGETTLHAWWHEPSYEVVFDANVPSTASTRVSGSMDAITVPLAGEAKLPQVGYSLPGYAFIGWNTKADGSGVQYVNAATVSGLSQDDGATVTLYAMWRPLTYGIVLSAGLQTQTVSVGFDEPFELVWKDPIPDNERIVGWKGLGLGSFYAYGSEVVNLCRLKDDGTLASGEVSLNAVIAEEGVAYVTITDDGSGVELDPSEQIELTDESATLHKPFAKTLGNGVYATTGELSVPNGTYTVSIEGWNTRDAEIEIVGGSGMLSLEYFTVEVEADDHVSAWVVDPATGEHVDRITKRLAGDKIGIGVSAEAGYSFEGWTAGGVAPNWDASLASQDIVLNGPVVLQAHPAANVYTVVFDANADGVSGSMERQDMVYGEPQGLFANGFSREGYDFAGWTTTPEWTGTLYADGEQVQDLTTVQGDEVALYAQWTPWPYFVHFDPNGAGTVDPDEVLDQKFFHDQEQALMPCPFGLEGFHFLGWNTEADGSGEQFADGATVAENLTQEDGGRVTLYAQWERDYYTVVFDANGGEGEMDPQRVEIGLAESLDPCGFERGGYVFAGWNTAPDGSGASYQPGAALEEDLAEAGGSVTLYAQWEESPEPEPEPEPTPTPDPDPEPDPAPQTPKEQTGGSDGLSATSDSGTVPFAAAALIGMLAASALAVCRVKGRR